MDFSMLRNVNYIGENSAKWTNDVPIFEFRWTTDF